MGDIKVMASPLSFVMFLEIIECNPRFSGWPLLCRCTKWIFKIMKSKKWETSILYAMSSIQAWRYLTLCSSFDVTAEFRPEWNWSQNLDLLHEIAGCKNVWVTRQDDFAWGRLQFACLEDETDCIFATREQLHSQSIRFRETGKDY